MVTRSFYNNFIYLFKYYLLTYSNLTSQAPRVEEFISIYLHNAENQDGVTFNPLFCTTMGV